MLNKAERLNHSLFSKYYQEGKRIHNKYTTIIVSPYHKFMGSVVVGKKVAKKAHDRNKIKRRVYEIVRYLKTKGEVNGVYIIIAKPIIKDLNKKEFRSILTLEVGRVLK